MSNLTLVVIGSGQGIGITTATYFASKKFSNIALISRNSENLNRDKKTLLEGVASTGRQINVQTWAVDITYTPGLNKVFSEVENIGDVSCVLFNAARVDMSTLLEYSEDEILKDFKTTTIALHTTATWAIPILQKQQDKPTILVTSGYVSKEPLPELFSLSLVKAAQRNLVMSLQTAYPDVHIALLYVNGRVTPESKFLSPEIVAGRFWGLYEQEKESWAKEENVNEG